MTNSHVSYVALEQLERNMDDCEALEAYRFIHRLFDTFGRLISNVKTELLNFNKKFKRSELKFYHDSKRFGISNLVEKKYFESKMEVPIPSGMKVSYIKAVTVVNQLYKELDITDTISILVEYLRNDVKNKSPIDITRKISKTTKLHVEVKLRSVFSSNKTLDVPLGSVFANFNEVMVVDSDILKYEKIFKEVPDLCEKLTLIEDLVDKVITELEHDNRVNRVYIKALHDLIKTAAVQLDLFGVLIATMQIIEHNFVIVLNKLVMGAPRT